MRMLALRGGGRLPVIGQGTWGMGLRRGQRRSEIEALRYGFSLGMTLVDTAEIYGVGGAEEIVGEAIRGCREAIFLVTKIWPSHARPADLRPALAASLRRMGTDHADLVLLHWPTRGVPLAEILEGLRAVRREGLTGHIGVSNFDMRWLGRLEALEERPGEILCNELPYSVDRRAVERGEIAEAQASGRFVLAYSPLGHGRLRTGPGLRQVAAERGVSPQEIALAWVVRGEGVVAIPKAATKRHVAANARAGDVALQPEELGLIARDLAATPPFRPALPDSGWFMRLAYGGMRLQRRLTGQG